MSVSDSLQFNHSNYIEISQALIKIDVHYLMQLRDFKPTILYPGHWGFFAGHWKNHETAVVAMMRELNEELCWQPKILTYLGNIIVGGNHRIHVHKCQLNCGLESLTLQEGQEIGAFTKEGIADNTLFSQNLNKHFPVTPISAKVFKRFIVKDTNAR